MDLAVLGLTAHEEQVYAALVARPGTSATRLAADVGIGVAAVSRTLAGLVQRHLATRTPGRPPRFTAAPPDATLTTLVLDREHDLDAARAAVQRLTVTHREASHITHADIAIELLTDPQNVGDASRRLLNSAQDQVRAFDRPPYLARPGANLERQVERQRTGVLHRVIYSRDSVTWPGRFAGDIVPSVRAGERARVRNELPIKMIIRDDQEALIPFSFAPGGLAIGYLVRKSPMLDALESLFEAEWERAMALDVRAGLAGIPHQSTGPEAPEAADGPDDETRELLGLLTAGLTDAAIGRARGWSPRTTQRRIQRVMTILGAETRFQAALTAARRGWV